MSTDSQGYDGSLEPRVAGASSQPMPSPELRSEEPAAAVPSVDRPSFVARLLSIAIPIGICLAGVAVAGLLVATRPEAERADRQAQGVPVRTHALSASSQRVSVRAQGTVIAAQKVILQPELSGRIIAMHEDLVPGGRVQQGETLVRIDPRDYRAALEQQRAQLENSRVTISQEQGRRTIAEREWELLRQERAATSEQGRELALREPQVRSAEASVRAARSALQQARTNLSRTSLEAPFDAFVQAENADLGQLVAPSSQLATLVGTDHFWVQVAVPLDQLRWIRVPGVNADEGSEVTVHQEVGERGRIERSGRVVRLLGDLDPVGRMARILVEIDDPLGLSGETARGPRGDGDDGAAASSLPMLLGAFVHVQIEAGTLDGVFEVPRSALHAGDVVHLYGEGGALQVREVDVVWRREDSVLVRGLDEGAQLIVSSVPSAIDGMQLRLAEPPAGDGGGGEGGASPAGGPSAGAEASR